MGLRTKKLRSNSQRMANMSRNNIQGGKQEELTKFLSTSEDDSMDDVTSYTGYNSKKNRERNSSLEKILSVLLIVSVITILTLCVLLFLQKFFPEDEFETCQTPSCVIASGLVLQNMNLSVDPCTDFYTYSCGGWEANAIVPPDRKKWGVFASISERNYARVKRLLDNTNGLYKGKESTAIMKSKLYYNACMDFTAREKVKKERLLEVVMNIGGWSMTNNSWKNEEWSLEKALVRTHMLKKYPLFTVVVTADDKNSTHQIIAFDQSGLTLDDIRQYRGANAVKYKGAFIKYISTIGVLLGGDYPNTKKIATDIWEFETKLSQLMDPPEERQDDRKLYHKMTAGEVQNKFFNGTLTLSAYLNLLFREYISPKENVLVYAPKYLTKMSNLIKQTNKQILANYIAWHAVAMFVPYMPQAYRQALLELTSVLTGVKSSSQPWKICVVRTDDAFGFATGALYIEQYYSQQDRNKTELIISLIRDTFTDNLPNVEWMDNATRAKAIEKAKAVVQKIGYPEFLDDVDKLDKYYENLSVTGNDTFGNVLSALRFYKMKNLHKRGKPTDKTEWSMVPAEANAYYTPVSNEIVFPAGILQRSIYDPSFPMALLFGSLGMVVGHELTHGFDSTGRLFDLNGSMSNWWTDKASKAFDNQTKCLVKQYSNYTVGGQNVNGITTLKENIADNGGTKTSYKAYQRWLKNNNYEEHFGRLPGLNLTERQLFFVGFAQVWCSYYTPEYAKQALLTDEHGPAKYRVIGTLSNMPEFSEAYKCKPNATMNPLKKCSVW